MYTRPTAPRSIGGVLDDAIRLYTASFRAWLWPALASAVLAAALQVAMTVVMGTRPSPQAIMGWIGSPVVLVSYLAFIALSVVLYCAVIAGVNATFLGRDASPRASFATGLAVLPAAILAGFLSAFGSALGLLLLIVPGMILMGRWLVSSVVLVAERTSGVKALERSWHLVGGYWWRTVTVVFIAGVIIIVLAFAVPMLVGIIFGVLQRPAALDVAMIVLTGVERVFTAAAIPAALVAVYYDLRLRKEGGDLGARVDALSTG